MFFIALLLGIGADVGFLTEAERADDGQRHLPHAEFGGHRGEMALKGEVHQGGMDDVILVMAQSDLRATQFLGKIEELFAALPGAEEAGGLLFALARRRTVSSSGTFVGSDFAYVGSGETGGDDVQGDVEVVTERLEVGGVRFVMNILHPNVQGFDGEVGDMNLGAAGKKL